MQVINAAEILNRNYALDELVLEADRDLSIDFKDIDKIGVNDVSMLLNLKKIAILNRKNIQINNAEPNVMQVLDVTGLNKSFDCRVSNPI